MLRPLLNLVKGAFVLGCLLFLSNNLYGQGCCPEPGTCNPCNGGITKLTLRFHGILPALVRGYDNGNGIFTQWVWPGTTFTVTGESNGNFAGNNLYLYLVPSISPNAVIKTNCSLNLDPATFYGLFTIVSAESRTGGLMCCTTNTGSLTAPEIFGCPGNIALNTGTSCNAVADWTPPTAPDCDVVSFTSSHSPGSTFPVGVTDVTYTATSTNGQTSTCTFKVTVTDHTLPTVITPTPNITINAGSDCKGVASWTAPSFSDNCGVSSVTSTHTSGSSFALGTTTVRYTASDAAGNKVTSSFTVTVKDATPPTVTNCPADIMVEAASGCSATASWTAPTFNDACSAVTVTSSHTPGVTLATGSHDVIYTAQDAAGNKSTCSFKVVIKDKTPPSFTSCPSDTTITTTAASGVRYSWTPPIANDLCSTTTVTSTHTPGSNFPMGITTVVYTATDVSGNKAECTFAVTVKPESTKLDVIQLLTPDGNAVNDTWIIGNIELYQQNKVTVVDRWGSVVYSASGYDNEQRAWRGRNSQGDLVPAGTYFYVISIRSGNSTTETRGFIEVVR